MESASRAVRRGYPPPGLRGECRLTPAPSSSLRWSLLEDDALAVEADAALLEPVRAWLPLSHRRRCLSASNAATMRLRASEAESPPFVVENRPLLRLGTVFGWSEAEGRRLAIRGSRGATGSIDLVALTADLSATAGPASTADAMEIHSLLTLSAGVLLPGLDAALAHAGAVVTPAGGALLLVGDSHAGKTTTCANLIAEGWGFLSDDQIVLRDAGDRITTEGWLRTFHLDRGWRTGRPTGLREDAAPLTLGPGLWQPSAPCSGLLFPEVDAEQPTRVLPVTQGEALAHLIRQSPWLLADSAIAARGLALLRRTASYPAFRLSLGLDTFRDGARLADLLEATFPDRPGQGATTP